MQAIHAVSDGPWVPLRIGELRAREGAYVWRRLLDAGVVIANGTDAPVEPIDPVASFHASVTRRMQDGRAFFPEQAMSREEALASYTRAGAYAAFEEEIKGSLTAGKLADITVFSRDLLRVPEPEIRATKVVYTIVGGEVVYEAGD
jgi:predicted amidohydrolase YtcJ